MDDETIDEGIQRVHCIQGTALAKISEHLKLIEGSVNEIKTDQKELIQKIQAGEIERAKYPTPEEVKNYIRRIDAHDIYFYFIGTALVIIIGIFSGFFQRVGSLVLGG